MLCKSANLRICRGVFLATHVFVSQQNHSTHLGRLERTPPPWAAGSCRRRSLPRLGTVKSPRPPLAVEGSDVFSYKRPKIPTATCLHRFPILQRIRIDV